MKKIVFNESGMLYPYVLLLFMVVNMAIILGVDTFVGKQQTADYLAEYYEIRIMEVMAFNRLLPELEAEKTVSGNIKTNHGTVVYSATPDKKNTKLVNIVLKTTNEQSSFTSQFIYNKEVKQIIMKVS